MADYFDDDELMHDYIEEDFEPPPELEYDDAMIEEMMEEEPAPKVAEPKQQTEQEENSVSDCIVPPQVSTPAMENEEPEESSAEANNVPVQEITTAPVSLPRARRDIFSFEW